LVATYRQSEDPKSDKFSAPLEGSLRGRDEVEPPNWGPE
jgi:hypothetical protein